jgi:hypothetical protein
MTYSSFFSFPLQSAMFFLPRLPHEIRGPPSKTRR